MKALVTGASSGMGLDMAKYLSKLGYDLFVVSKDKEKLDNIYKDYKNVKTIGLDLTKMKKRKYAKDLKHLTVQTQ